MASEVMPSPYDEGVDLGRALCRDGVPLIRVRLTIARRAIERHMKDWPPVLD